LFFNNNANGVRLQGNYTDTATSQIKIVSATSTTTLLNITNGQFFASGTSSLTMNGLITSTGTWSLGVAANQQTMLPTTLTYNGRAAVTAAQSYLTVRDLSSIVIGPSAILDTFNEANSQSQTLNILGSAATGGGVVEFSAGFTADQPDVN